MATRQINLRRQQLKGGCWQTDKVLLEVADRDGWRLVIEQAHKLGNRQHFVRFKKYSPTGRFYFCEGLTLTMTHWERLAGVFLGIMDHKVEEAEDKATASHARGKFMMYGYWKAIAVHLRKVKRELKKTLIMSI